MLAIITQVLNTAPDVPVTTGDLSTNIHLDIRGTRFTLSRAELMALPESILLCLFPNGVFVDAHGNVISNLAESDVVYVNFAPECFQYILDQFRAAVRDGATLLPVPLHSDVSDSEVLRHRPSIIVLREDLDYYCIPPHTGASEEQMRELKLAAGQALVEKSLIFDGLGYAPGTKLGAAEQHLLDMLCHSGYSVEDHWGHRSMEPGKTVVNLMALVRLHEPEEEENGLTPVTSSNSLKPTPSSGLRLRSTRLRLSELAHAATERARSASRPRKQAPQSKLLLFWRKPARKCWWSHHEVDVAVVNNTVLGLKEVETVRVHIRRVWTLELSVIGV